jgi:hypothetical protein
LPISPFSQRIVLTPSLASHSAVQTPAIPPPMMTTSAFSASRYGLTRIARHVSKMAVAQPGQATALNPLKTLTALTPISSTA